MVLMCFSMCLVRCGHGGCIVLVSLSIPKPYQRSLSFPRACVRACVHVCLWLWLWLCLCVCVGVCGQTCGRACVCVGVRVSAWACASVRGRADVQARARLHTQGAGKPNAER